MCLYVNRFLLLQMLYANALAHINSSTNAPLCMIFFQCCLRFCTRVHSGSREIYCTDCNSMVVFVLSEDTYYIRQTYIIHEFNWFKCKYLVEILWLELPKWEFGRRSSLVQKWYVRWWRGFFLFFFITFECCSHIKYERYGSLERFSPKIYLRNVIRKEI